MYTIAAILAGGSGTRFGGEKPKQFLDLDGHTVLYHSLAAFERSRDVDEVCLVVPATWLGAGRDEVKHGGFRKVRHVVCGGRERSDSSIAALRCYEGREGCILLHDAARPLVSQRVITTVVQALEAHEAAAAAVPCVDTIVVQQGGVLRDVPPRATLARMQTPQGFHLDTLRRAYELALRDPAFQATDDCGVVRRYLPDVPIHLVRGEERNRKLTYAGELPLLRFLLAQGEDAAEAAD